MNMHLGPNKLELSVIVLAVLAAGYWAGLMVGTNTPKSDQLSAQVKLLSTQLTQERTAHKECIATIERFGTQRYRERLAQQAK